jgi:hypothetical protein
MDFIQGRLLDIRQIKFDRMAFISQKIGVIPSQDVGYWIYALSMK